VYELVFSDKAAEDLLYFKRYDARSYRKALSILEELMKHPYAGTGKPERLRYELSGSWSRRINSEHRVVYTVHEDTAEAHILAMRYHYMK
jgi:toxin YoeB